MELTKSEYDTMVLACQFTLSEVARVLDEGKCSPAESMVAVRRIRELNHILEVLNNARCIGNDRSEL